MPDQAPYPKEGWWKTDEPPKDYRDRKPPDYEPHDAPNTEYKASTRWYMHHYGTDVSKWPYDPAKEK
jgi:hypothetical protein